MPENTNFIGFGQSLTVELPSDLGSPVFISFEDQDLYRRTIRLNQIEESEDTSPIPSWDGRQIWIVSHGWNSNYNGYGRDLGLSIKQAKPQDIVLAIDWENAARTTLIGDPNSSPELISNINDGLGLVAVGAPFYAATWIGVVADVVAQQLAAWGVRNEAINFVGHSLGTLLNNEIAYRLINTYAPLDLYRINGQFVDDGEGGLPIFGNGDLSGNNLVYLGEGDDEIDLSGGAESGNDRIFGEAGDDRINAGDGDDELRGGAGNDILAGEEGTDTAFFTGNFASTHLIDN